MAQDERKPKKDDSREERLERIKQLLSDRGEDAARVVKKWLAEQEDDKRGR